MSSSSREEIVEVFDALKADFKRALDLSFDALTTPERLALLQCCETFRTPANSARNSVFRGFTANPEPTSTTTPKNSCRPTTKTTGP
jgi:hypothetical protein